MPNLLIDKALLGGGSDQTSVKAHQERKLRNMIDAMWRRKYLMIMVVLLGLACAVVTIPRLGPYYTAEVQLTLTSRKTVYANFNPVVSGLNPDLLTLRSEINAMQSRATVGRVVDQLGLTHDPEFNAIEDDNRPPSPWSMLFGKVKGIFNWLLGSKTAVHTDPMLRDARANTVNRVLDNLQAENDNKSYTITLNFTSVDPSKAAQIANATARQYLLDQVQQNLEATLQVNEWLAKELAAARAEVRDAETEIEKFREANGIIETGVGAITIAMQQFNEINSQLVAAGTVRTTAEARLRQAQELVQSGSIDTIPEVLASSHIQSLMRAQSDLRRREAEQRSLLGTNHPSVRGLRAEVENLGREIRAEINKIVVSLASEFEIARNREQELLLKLTEVQNKVAVANRAQARLRELEQEAEDKRGLLQSYNERYEQTSALKNIIKPDVRIVASAEIPLAPSRPNKMGIFLLALLGSCAVAVVLVLVLERSDRGFRTTTQIEALTGIPCLGMVPSFASAKVRRNLPIRAIALDSPFIRAIRAIRPLIYRDNTDAGSKAFLVTSSVPAEGKSVFAAGFARTLAEAGQRTLLIDCDLHHPSIARLMGNPAGPALTEVIRGDSAIDPVQLNENGVNGHLHMIAGTTDGRYYQKAPESLLGSPEMEQFILLARQKYDVIVLDAPPAMIAPETLPLSSFADAILYVVEWGSTPQEIVCAGLRKLRLARAPMTGTILSKVNLKRHVKYKFPDEGYFSYYYSSVLRTPRRWRIWNIAGVAVLAVAIAAVGSIIVTVLLTHEAGVRHRVEYSTDRSIQSQDVVRAEPAAFRAGTEAVPRPAALSICAAGSADAKVASVPRDGDGSQACGFSRDNDEPSTHSATPPLSAAADPNGTPTALANRDGVKASVVETPALMVRAAEPARLSQAMKRPDLGHLMERAENFLSAHDIVSARLIYYYLNEKEVSGAATMIGRTYDPVFLAERKVGGSFADPAKAIEWYRTAIRAGDQSAMELLQRLQESQ